MYGQLELCVGPMFSGKTTTLLKNVLWAKSTGKKIKVFKPAFDDRWGTVDIVSHDGMRTEATQIGSWEPGYELLDDDSLPEIVFFDEVQFFTDEISIFQGDIIAAIQGLLKQGVNVLAVGLDMDWQGNAFSVSASLAAMADTITKLHANCAVCGRPAGKTHLISNEGSRFLIGDSLYQSRCNEHWGRS